jgi:hypothetical protein
MVYDPRVDGLSTTPCAHTIDGAGNDGSNVAWGAVGAAPRRLPTPTRSR